MNPFNFNLSLLFALAFTTGCQVYNSSSGDVVTYQTGGPSVLQNHCTPCHGFGTMTVDALVAQGLIVKGSSVTSQIFLRIRGSNSGGPENMPPSGSTGGDLTDDEITTVKNWIDGL